VQEHQEKSMPATLNAKKIAKVNIVIIMLARPAGGQVYQNM
jgi:hypothetical protein